MPNEQGVFDEEDLRRLRVVFPTLPTWRASDASIGIEDLGGFWKGIGWKRTAEQMELYTEFWRQAGVGPEKRVPLELMAALAGTTADKAAWVTAIIKACDANKDGFMQPDEYKVFFGIFGHHYPEWNVSYEDFVAGADVNHDGKVSVDEAIDWILKWVADKGQNI